MSDQQPEIVIEKKIEVIETTNITVHADPSQQSSNDDNKTKNNATNKSNNTDKKTTKTPPKPLTFREKLLVVSGLAYLIVPPITTALTSESSPESRDKIDNLYTPSGSAIRAVVNTGQFIIRAGLVAIGGIFAGAVSVISAVIIGGSAAGYFILAAPTANVSALRFKKSIPGLFLLGVPVGMLAMWPRQLVEGYDSSGSSKFLGYVAQYIQIGSFVLGGLGFAFFSKGYNEDEKTDKAEQEAAIKSSTSSKLAEMAKNTNIGEVEVDGEKTSDVTLGDIMSVAKTLAESSEERLKRWIKRPENIYSQTSRVICGTLWGFWLRAYYEFMKETFSPLVSALFYTGDSAVLSFLFRGFRGYDTLIRTRAAAMKALEEAAKNATTE